MMCEKQLNLKKMDKKKVLIIGMVWPEPGSSAAGTRIIQLMKLFLSLGHELVFASAAAKSDFSCDLSILQVAEWNINLNDYEFNRQLKAGQPDIVIYDRFVTEEQYGWRVTQECPGALKILDTEDLHFLRLARQAAIKAGRLFTSDDLYSDMAKREIASVFRCDLSLIISEAEMLILRQQFRIEQSLLYHLPFMEEEISETISTHWKPFEEREGFVFIGNYLHEPNWHTLQILKTKIWPALSKKLPGTGMHIYGAYASEKVMQLNNITGKFYVHGRAADAREVIAKHKVLLAPIEFGAGLKGKFIDAMQAGTPAVTTTIGAEAMNGTLDWNGAIADDPEIFIYEAVKLYQDQHSWRQAQQNGITIINERYSALKLAAPFEERLSKLITYLKTHRQHNFTGQILQHHMLNSTKYMSLWIEEKTANKGRGN